MRSNLNKKSLPDSVSLLLILPLLFLITILGYYYIHISSEFKKLKTDKIPSVNLIIDNLKNDILVQNNKNDFLIRNTIREKAKKLGMKKISDKNRINTKLYR